MLISRPRYLYTRKKEDNVKPITKPFKYIVKILIIIPIMDIPNIHIEDIKMILLINEFLNALKLLILLLFILVINVVIWLITSSLSVLFNAIKNILPDIIPNIIMKNTNKFIFLFGRIMASPLLNFLFILLSPLKYIKKY